MKKIITAFITLVILTLPSAKVSAQDDIKLISGNSLNIFIPQGTLANTYDHGFGLYANIDYNLNEYFALRTDIGWNDLSGPETTYIDTEGVIHSSHPNMSIWEFTAGLKAQISIFYVEARGGYFSGVNDFGVVPAVGLRIGKLDIQGNYNFVGDSEWASARICYYWGK